MGSALKSQCFFTFSAVVPYKITLHHITNLDKWFDSN